MEAVRSTSFWQDDRGAGTLFGLLWFVLLVGITGMAVDITDGLRNRTMLQATADAAALAGAHRPAGPGRRGGHRGGLCGRKHG